MDTISTSLFFQLLSAFFTLFIVAYIWKFLVDRFREVQKQRAKVENVEHVYHEESEKKEVSLVKYIELTLSLASERERLTMIKAQGRAGMLFIIGTILMVMSVFAPFASIATYLSTDLLSSETVTALKTLKEELGISPSAKDIINQRDWRILFSGISFGFLFLAAARGLLRQEGQQMTTFLKLGQSIAYYESIVSALKIAERKELKRIGGLSPEDRSEEPNLDDLVTRIVNLLLEPPSNLISQSDSAEKPLEAHEVPLKEQLEAVKKTLRL